MRLIGIQQQHCLLSNVPLLERNDLTHRTSDVIKVVLVASDHNIRLLISRLATLWHDVITWVMLERRHAPHRPKKSSEPAAAAFLLTVDLGLYGRIHRVLRSVIWLGLANKCTGIMCYDIMAFLTTTSRFLLHPGSTARV